MMKIGEMFRTAMHRAAARRRRRMVLARTKRVLKTAGKAAAFAGLTAGAAAVMREVRHPWRCLHRGFTES